MPPRKATKKTSSTAGGAEDNRLPVIPVTGVSTGASGPVNDGAASVNTALSGATSGKLTRKSTRSQSTKTSQPTGASGSVATATNVQVSLANLTETVATPWDRERRGGSVQGGGVTVETQTSESDVVQNFNQVPSSSRTSVHIEGADAVPRSSASFLAQAVNPASVTFADNPAMIVTSAVNPAIAEVSADYPAMTRASMPQMPVTAVQFPSSSAVRESQDLHYSQKLSSQTGQMLQRSGETPGLVDFASSSEFGRSHPNPSRRRSRSASGYGSLPLIGDVFLRHRRWIYQHSDR
jgi:hypothetical protein